MTFILDRFLSQVSYGLNILVRAERIELSHQAWEARRLPLHYAR